MGKLLSALDAYAPGVREELSQFGKSRSEWLRRPSSGLLQRVVRVRADGPLLKAHLGVYGAKLAMALYREHVGTALPLDGAIWCQFALNGGMTQEHLNERIKILPGSSTLRQGEMNVTPSSRIATTAMGGPLSQPSRSSTVACGSPCSRRGSRKLSGYSKSRSF
jgi:hypothetical protein